MSHGGMDLIRRHEVNSTRQSRNKHCIVKGIISHSTLTGTRWIALRAPVAG
jgi:hypothetical protein